jgi:hypothetical protein
MASKPKTPPPLTLAEVNIKYGAPMGRHYFHRVGLTDPQFQLERVPLTDGGYDCGGAYWGTPDDLWLADFTTPITGTTIARYFIRASSRDEAMEVVKRDYKTAKFLPETGSIIEQTIKFLQNYRDRLDAQGDDDFEEQLMDVENEITILEEDLANIRSKHGSPVQG